MFNEVAFLDRFEQAAVAGFKAVEFQLPYDHSPSDIATKLHDHNLQLVLFNMPAGDWQNGDRGLACIPDREMEFLVGVGASLQYAKAMNCHQIHMLEPINQTDMPGYFLHTQEQAIDLIASANQPNVALQMDLYHCLMAQGDPAHYLRANLKHISHIQIAGVPGRHEPDIGEMKYGELFALIDELGYDGFVGCEYIPAGDPAAGLGWASPYLSG